MLVRESKEGERERESARKSGLAISTYRARTACIGGSQRRVSCTYAITLSAGLGEPIGSLLLSCRPLFLNIKGLKQV